MRKQMFEGNHKWLAVGITAVLIMSALAAQPAFGQIKDPQAQATPAPVVYNRTISVNGTGSAQVEPDVAVINIGVQTDAKTASEALTQNSKQMDAVLSTLRSAGVANNDIRTTFVQVYPRYDVPPQPQQGQNGQNRLSGYTATNSVEVRVLKLDNLGTILDQVVSAGSNRIDSIRFEVSNQDAAMQQAREAAMQNARSKAEQLARLADGKLGQVLTITESSQGPIVFDSMAREQAAGGAAVPISPGTQPVDVNLQVTWELQ